MARVEKYREAVQQLIKQHASIKDKSEVESQIIFDTEHDDYQLVDVGWHKRRRIYGCLLHFDIKDGKVWVQYNGTEQLVGEELVELGVLPSDIVLGFHPPYKRPYTGFATN